jgi:electron transfer flavoprotein beta subunit
MDLGVLVKASLDVNMVKADSEGRVLLDSIPLAISEYDRNAVYEAVKIREKRGGKVLVFSVLTWGPIDKRSKEIENVMREALSLGADEAYVVIDEAIIDGDVNVTANVLGGLINKVGDVDLILTGEGSMDIMSSQLPVRLGHILGFPVATFARKIELGNGTIRVTRDLEDKLQVVELPLPAVVSVTGEINQPKLPTLLQIRRSFSKPYNVHDLSSIGLDGVEKMFPMDGIRLVTISRKNVILEGGSLDDIAEELLDRLMEEGAVKV